MALSLRSFFCNTTQSRGQTGSLIKIFWVFWKFLECVSAFFICFRLYLWQYGSDWKTVSFVFKFLAYLEIFRTCVYILSVSEYLYTVTHTIQYKTVLGRQSLLWHGCNTLSVYADQLSTNIPLVRMQYIMWVYRRIESLFAHFHD